MKKSRPAELLGRAWLCDSPRRGGVVAIDSASVRGPLNSAPAGAAAHGASTTVHVYSHEVQHAQQVTAKWHCLGLMGVLAASILIQISR